jgi:hypothetical protein
MEDSMSDPTDDFEGIIGTRPRRTTDRERLMARGGSRRGLSYEVVWDGLRGRAFGSLTIRIDNVPVWGTDDAGVSRDWTSLLQFLTSRWARLLFEQSYPGSVTPLWPTDLSRTLSQSRPSLGQLDREYHLRSFGLDHNLARFEKKPLRGRPIPDLLIMREGNLMTFDAKLARLRWSFADAVRSLESLGNAIAERVGQTGWGNTAVQAWARRDDVSDDVIQSISLGLPHRQANQLSRSGILPRPTKLELLRDTSELAAAARLTGAQFSEHDLEAVAAAIPGLPAHPTEELDEIGREATTKLAETEDLRPHEQGQFVAQWLRKKLGLWDQEVRVDPDRLLRDWSIEIRQVSLARAIEAICVWGPRCGPAILINPEGDHNRSLARVGEWSGGMRATLAHEICHLLLDRGRSLPVAEVMGGSTPAYLEQRANAFAAEFLLPRAWAVRMLRQSADAQEALGGICETYRVSETLAAWQILNHGRDSLSETDLSVFENIVARWG